MRKILIIAPSNAGTMGLRAMDLYRAFAQQSDLETKIVFLHKIDNGFNIDGLEYCNYFKNTTYDRFVNFLKEVRWLKRIKRIYKPDLSISTVIACNICNVLTFSSEKKIGLFRAPYEQIIRAMGIIYRFYHNWIFSRLDYLVCVSIEVSDSMKKHFPSIPQNRFKTIYNAFFIDEIHEKMNESLDESDGEAYKRPVIIYVCRLNTLKAPERLIQAFARSQVRETYNLVLVGADSENRLPELQLLSKDLGVENNVYFLGKKSNPYKYLKRASISASSSITEGLPGVLIESLIVGTPVIFTNCSKGVWEILECDDNYQPDLNTTYIAENGIITSNGDNVEVNIENMKDAINYMVDHPFKCEDVKFLSRVTPKGIVDSYLKLIEQ